MVISDNKYDLLLQNNASKEFTIYSGLTNISDNHLYYHFDVELDVPDGEYTYVVQVDNRDDVEYELKTPILSTMIHTGDGDVLLRDLQPATTIPQGAYSAMSTGLALLKSLPCPPPPCQVITPWLRCS